MSTATTHRRIEQLAAAFIDMLPTLKASPAMQAKAIETALLEPSYTEMCGIAAAIAAYGNQGTLVSRLRGGSAALSTAALVDVLFGRQRQPLTWCPHRSTIDGDPVMVAAVLRHAGCPSCFASRTKAADEQLATDTVCDVCGADDGKVTPRLMPFAATMVTLFTGKCCDPLFDYETPGSTTIRFRRVGRNEACPCGSTRKFKRCHGVVLV